MSYHNIPSSAIQSVTNAQGQTAPAGYHYMPDGKDKIVIIIIL